MVQSILSFKKMSSRIQNVLTYIVFWEDFDQKTILFNPYNFGKFLPKDNMIQLILSFKKILIKRQYCSIHIIFLENFNQRTIRFNPYCLFRKFWSKDNTVQPIVFIENVDRKTIIGLNPYSLLRNAWLEDNMAQPCSLVGKFWPKDNMV